MGPKVPKVSQAHQESLASQVLMGGMAFLAGRVYKETSAFQQRGVHVRGENLVTRVYQGCLDVQDHQGWLVGGAPRGRVEIQDFQE